MRFGSIFICLFFAFTPIFVSAQAVSLDETVRIGAGYLQGRFPKGTRAVIVAVQSENTEIGEFVLNRLSNVLVNGGWFTVVVRDNAALERLAKEVSYQLSGEVSDETSISIGKQLGAQVIISGKFIRSGQNWQLELQGFYVESGVRAAQWFAENIRWTPPVTPRTAGITFGGHSMTERDKKTVTDGLRSAIQTGKVSLELDEKAVDHTGYGFTITVYRDPAGTDRNTLIKADVSVDFTRNGRPICNTGPYYITESSETMLARRIAERLRADQAFFSKINETVK